MNSSKTDPLRVLDALLGKAQAHYDANIPWKEFHDRYLSPEGAVFAELDEERRRMMFHDRRFKKIHRFAIELESRQSASKSGRFNLRVPSSMHEQLAILAERERVSQNGLCVDLLREALTRRMEPAMQQSFADSYQAGPLPSSSPLHADPAIGGADLFTVWQQLIEPFISTKIAKRLLTAHREKRAFSLPLVRYLSDELDHRNDDETALGLFLESGSTIALATEQLRTHDDIRSHLRIVTNNLLAWMALSRDPTEPVLLAGEWDPKYCGTFTFPNYLPGVRDSASLVHSAYETLRKELFHQCDTLILTASRLSFTEGPFVGSCQNALFKHAALSVMKKITFLLDGRKVLFGKDMLSQQRDACRQVLFPNDGTRGTSEKVPITHVDSLLQKSREWTWIDAVFDREDSSSVEIWIAGPFFPQSEEQRMEDPTLRALGYNASYASDPHALFRNALSAELEAANRAARRKGYKNGLVVRRLHSGEIDNEPIYRVSVE